MKGYILPAQEEELPGRFGPDETSAPFREPIPSESALLAYRLHRSPLLPIVPAGVDRSWMNGVEGAQYAKRCLPLLVANQSGWLLLSSHAVFVMWTGDNGASSLKVTYPRGTGPFPAISHFGHGILTWRIPYLFRTPPGYNLLVRGPANWPKDGIAPLEGVVETDWAEATFTMNWQLTRPNAVVSFSVGEPICMVVPQRRGELEAWQPEIRDIDSAPELSRRFDYWSEHRSAFMAEVNAEVELNSSTPHRRRPLKDTWQKDYFHGRSADGRHTSEHQTKLSLRPFAEQSADGMGS